MTETFDFSDEFWKTVEDEASMQIPELPQNFFVIEYSNDDHIITTIIRRLRDMYNDDNKLLGELLTMLFNESAIVSGRVVTHSMNIWIGDDQRENEDIARNDTSTDTAMDTS